MSIRRPNEFALLISNDDTEPENPMGVPVTPLQNAFAAPIPVFDSGHAEWWPVGSGHGYGLEVSLTGTVGSGNARSTIVRLYYVKAAASVDAGANTITFAEEHGLDTGDGGIDWATTGVLPGNVVDGVFAIRVDDFTFQIAATFADALAGTAIDITSAGSGVLTMTALKIVDLFACQAGNSMGSQAGSGAQYRFPGLWIPRLMEIHAAASQDHPTPTDVGVYLRLYCQPTKKWLLRTCTFVRTFGATPATSEGTAITPGNNAFGAYAQLGGALVEELDHWQVGMGINNSIFANTGQSVELAIDNGGVKRTAARRTFGTSSTELLNMISHGDMFFRAVVGETAHVRIANAGAPVAGFSAIAYGCGGRRVEPNAFTVASTVTIAGSPAPNGKTVEIYAVDADGDAELVTTALTGGGTGAFSAAVPDNTRSYYASYNNDGNYGRSALDTPV